MLLRGSTPDQIEPRRSRAQPDVVDILSRRRDTAYGSHKVSEIVDPVSKIEARAAGLQVLDSKRAVAVVVAECAREDKTAILSRGGWSALLAAGSRVTASVEPPSDRGLAQHRQDAARVRWRVRVLAGASAGTSGRP